MPHRAKINIIGPYGDLIRAGDDLPDNWPKSFVDDFARGGAVERESSSTTKAKASVKKIDVPTKKVEGS